MFFKYDNAIFLVTIGEILFLISNIYVNIFPIRIRFPHLSYETCILLINLELHTASFFT